MSLKSLLLFSLIVISHHSWAQAVEGSNEGNPLEPISMDLLWSSGIMNKLTLSQGTKRAKECLDKPDLTSPLCHLVRHVEKNIDSTTPLSDLFESRVVYVGERHITPESKLVIARHIKDIKQAGYTTLAMEMWNASSQEFVNSFLNHLVDPQAYEDTFHNQWSYKSAPYMEMMIAAREAGMKLLAIDVRDKIDKLQSYTFAQELNIRDGKMAENLSVYLKNNPQEKVLVFCGRLHAYTHLTTDNSQNSQIQYLEEKTGIRGQSFIVVEGSDNSPWNFAFKALGAKSGTITADPQVHFTNTVIFVESSDKAEYSGK